MMNECGGIMQVNYLFRSMDFVEQVFIFLLPPPMPISFTPLKSYGFLGFITDILIFWFPLNLVPGLAP